MSARVGEPLAEPRVSTWLNTKEPIRLTNLRGKVVVIVTFQMLCPGCVMHALPQARRVRRHFAADDVAVLGLHTVFEHHDAMEEVSLRAFVEEYAIDFPVGLDAKGEASLPLTMADYGLGGTPCLLVADRAGILRVSHLGEVSDMLLGARIAELATISETSRRGGPPIAGGSVAEPGGVCTTP